MRILKEFLYILILIILLDSIWFSFSLKTHYTSIKVLLRKKIKKNIGILVWLLISFMQYNYVIIPLKNIKYKKYLSLKNGMVLGFLISSIYNGTNIAFLKDWTYKASLYDIIYVTLSQGIVSHFSYKLIKNK